MRSLSRAAVVSALALPLVLGGAGLAAAEDTMMDRGGCCSQSHWAWGSWFNWGTVNDDDTQVINAGIIG